MAVAHRQTCSEEIQARPEAAEIQVTLEAAEMPEIEGAGKLDLVSSAHRLVLRKRESFEQI
jgi:hypothetical protein